MLFFENLKQQSYLCSVFRTYKYVGQDLVYNLFPSKYVISTVFWSLTGNFISGIYLVQNRFCKTSFLLSFKLSEPCRPFLLDIFRFLNRTYRVQKWNCYLSPRTLTSKNIGGILFTVCFPLNIFFLPFSAIFIWKCINHTSLLAIDMVNTPRTPDFFVLNH